MNANLQTRFTVRAVTYSRQIRYVNWLRAGRSDDRGSNTCGGWKFLLSTPCLDRLWCPLSL